MKTLGITIAALTLAASAFGQGQVNFNNRVTTGTPIFAPIYGVNPANPLTQMRGNATTNGGSQNYAGVPLLSGSGFTAQLWAGTAGTPEAALAEVAGATTTFQTATTLPGIIRGVVGTLPFVTADGTQVAFQVRAWNNNGGTVLTWADAMLRAQAGTGSAGSSAIFNAPISPIPAAPGNLVGMTSFNLTTVPEPGVIALGVLGLGALLLRRRKTS
jgi:hypothetical protein